MRLDYQKLLPPPLILLAGSVPDLKVCKN